MKNLRRRLHETVDVYDDHTAVAENVAASAEPMMRPDHRAKPHSRPSVSSRPFCANRPRRYPVPDAATCDVWDYDPRLDAELRLDVEVAA